MIIAICLIFYAGVGLYCFFEGRAQARHHARCEAVRNARWAAWEAAYGR